MKKERKKEASKDGRLALCLGLLVLALVAIPPAVLRNAEFGGSDDAGSQKIEELQKDYKPWFTPVLEQFLQGEIPGEIESLLFCLQTGIGVGVIAFFMGRFAERKRWEQKYPEGRDV